MEENNMILERPEPIVPSIFDAAKDPTSEQMLHLQQLGDSMQEHMIKGDLNNAPVMPNAFLPKRKQLIKDHKIGRNDTCPCGSGKKYKKCCLNEGTYESYSERK